MSHEYSLATKLDRQIQVIVVKVPLCSVTRVEDRLNLYFNYPEKGTGKNEKLMILGSPCLLLQHGICHGGGSIMGIKCHKPILRSDKTTYREQLTVRNEGFFYLSVLTTVVWIGQFCGTYSNDFNREGLGIEVDFSLPSESVVRALNQIISWRGKPLTIRVDNSPEYISATLQTEFFCVNFMENLV